jgi:hypothetical protein
MICFMTCEVTRLAHCRDHRDLHRCGTTPIGRPTGHHSLQLGHRLHGAIDGYATGIVRLIGESYGRQTVQNAWSDFNIGGTREFCGHESNAELFYSWLFHHWAPVREKGHEVYDETLYGIPPTRAYLDRRPSALNPRLRLYLEGCLGNLPGFYQVIECETGAGFRARDMLAGSVSTVADALASASLKRGDILYAHLVPLGQITLMEAISPWSFPPQFKRHLLRLCKHHRARDNAGPELRRIYLTLSATTALTHT